MTLGLAHHCDSYGHVRCDALYVCTLLCVVRGLIVRWNLVYARPLRDAVIVHSHAAILLEPGAVDCHLMQRLPHVAPIVQRIAARCTLDLALLHQVGLREFSLFQHLESITVYFQHKFSYFLSRRHLDSATLERVDTVLARLSVHSFIARYSET